MCATRPDSVHRNILSALHVEELTWRQTLLQVPLPACLQTLPAQPPWTTSAWALPSTQTATPYRPHPAEASRLGVPVSVRGPAMREGSWLCQPSVQELAAGLQHVTRGWPYRTLESIHTRL